jgi:hypothetical protein
VIEPHQAGPAIDGVAIRAAGGASLLGCRGRPAGELSAVRVRVTRGAGAVRETISCDSNTGIAALSLMAVAASDRCVQAGQREACFHVSLEGKARGPKAFDTVAPFARGVSAFARELPRVHVRVAGRTPHIAEAVDRVRSARRVALDARHGGVPALQWIGCLIVHDGSERRWDESPHVVAGRTVAAVFPVGELATMRILYVAIHALCVRQRQVEVAAVVAVPACDAFVLPQ